jgi:signal peptidase I
MTEIFETIFDLLKTIVFVIVLAFLIRFFIFQPFVVQGISMEPTLHNSEYLIVDRLSYRFSEPHRGDVVVFPAPDNSKVDYIKRIIGLPGEEVKITDNHVYINNILIDEKYLPNDFKTLVNNKEGEALDKIVGPNELFVMGDNRENSYDSRFFGVIKKDSVVGKAWLILFPFKNLGKVYEPSY